MELECELCGRKVEIADTKAGMLKEIRKHFPNTRLMCRICRKELEEGN